MSNVPVVRVNGRETIDRGKYLGYVGDTAADLEVVKHNIGRYIYLYIRNKTSASTKVPPNTFMIPEYIDDELYKKAFLYDIHNDIYIDIVYHRLTTLLSLHGEIPYSSSELREFLYNQIR